CAGSDARVCAIERGATMIPRSREVGRVLAGLALLACAMMWASIASAAAMQLINRDDPGEGFNDPTPIDTLGEAQPVAAFYGFTGAPQPDVLYPSPLADRLAGIDLDPDNDDIQAQFN